MVNNEDAAIRTLAQKTQATNEEDHHLRTATQKEPAGGLALIKVGEGDKTVITFP